MNITKCQGEGQSSCKRCNDRGKWNRMWLCFLYCIEGMEGIYCSDCVKEIEKEQIKKQAIEEMAMLISGNEIQHCGHHDIAERLYNAGYRRQAWISVEDRLPTEQDADDDYGVLAIHKRSIKRYYHWKSVADNPFDFTYWMPLPEPVKMKGGAK